MRSLSAALVAVLTLGPGLARAQQVGAQPAAAQPSEQPAAPAVQPSSPAPVETPPSPPAQLPPPPQQPVQAAPAEAAAEPAPMTQQPEPQSAEATNAQGQWVYTQQYGWVWMPYGSQYTYAPTQAGVYPSEYVYYPSYGWTWIAAPWVFGWGVSPYFGAYGPSHFGWYHHWVGVGHGYHPGYGGYGYHPGYRGYGGYGYRPAPPYGGYHAGPVAPHPGFGAPGRVYGAPAVGRPPCSTGSRAGFTAAIRAVDSAAVAFTADSAAVAFTADSAAAMVVAATARLPCPAHGRRDGRARRSPTWTRRPGRTGSFLGFGAPNTSPLPGRGGRSAGARRL